MAARFSHRRGTESVVFIRRRPKSAVLHTAICGTRRSSLRQTSRRVVWTLCNRQVHSVGIRYSHYLGIALTGYRALSDQYQESGLKVYVNGDGADVYEDAFIKLAKVHDRTFTPTLILLGIRLGIDRVTPVYWEALKAALRLPQSIGIAG